ncbi:hypothetical protein ABPG72_021816 [Tetrahymena utriculariae]
MLNIKLYTSQKNTTSKAKETNFKNQNVLIPYNQRISIETKAQQHIMLVKDGPLIQNSSNIIIKKQSMKSTKDYYYDYKQIINFPAGRSYSPCTFPISYIINQQSLGQYRENPSTLLPANQIINIGYSVDETVQYIDIQFSTYPEVQLYATVLQLSLCGQGFWEDRWHRTFQKILKVNNLQVYHDIIQLEGLSQSFQEQTQSNEEHLGQICVPSITAKNQEFKLNSKRRIAYNDKFQDEIKESPSQPQIAFESQINAYQSIKKDIELQNSQQSSKLQNVQVESKIQDLYYATKRNILKRKDSTKSLFNPLIDFVSFYKDILLSKKAIMVLLSKEQLAALELVGCTDMFLEGGNIDKIVDHKGNHFEQQPISQSEELKCKYIDDFIFKCQQSQNLSSLDQRIFHC